MFEMSKNILEKVSFDKHLFSKELRKAVKWLNKEESLLLKMWCIAQFGHMYRPIINQVFRDLV